MSFERGQIIAYREKTKLILATIIEIKKTKLLILSEENDKGNISIEKVKISLKRTTDISLKDYETVRLIKKIKEEIDSISSKIKLEELYSLLYEEEQGYSYSELADLYFTKGEKPENILAMGLALSNNSLYFKLKNEAYFAKDKNLVEKEIEENNAKKLNEISRMEEEEKAMLWLKKFVEKAYDKELLPAPVEVLKILEPIKQYVIFREKCNKKETSLSIAKKIKQRTNFSMAISTEGLFNLLVKFNIFKENENLNLHKYHIPFKFKDEIISEAEKIKAFCIEDTEPTRKDLRKLFTFTIDDAETLDIDDALSLEFIDDNYKLGIHITDVADFIPPSSALDKEALNRRITLYLPECKVPMFPSILSDDMLSLKEGKDCPAMSFIMLFDKDFQLIDREIVLSIINVDKNMSYKDIDDTLNSKGDNYLIFSSLYSIAKSLYKNRTLNGAVEFNNSDIKIKINDNDEIMLTKTERGLKSDCIVKEAMILANHTCAEFCIAHDIPSIYFYQAPPSAPIVLNGEIRNNKHKLIEEMKKMKKSEVDLYPNNHFALGLSSYLQCTSPIRRYHDLIVQRQLKTNLISGGYYYSKDEIRVIAMGTEEAIRQAKDLEKESIRYWTLKYLEQENEKSRIFKATIIKKLISSYYVEIDEVATQALIINKSPYMELGKKIDVVLTKVKPLVDNLIVQPVF